MSSNSNCVEGNEVKSEIPFLHYILSSPHLPESHSLAVTTLNSSFPIFLEFSMYIPATFILLFLTHAKRAFKLGILRHYASFVRKAPLVFVASESFRTHDLLRTVTGSERQPETSLFKEEPHCHHHSLPQQSRLITVCPACSTMSDSQKVFDKYMTDAWVSTLVAHIHKHTQTLSYKCIDSFHKL